MASDQTMAALNRLRSVTALSETAGAPQGKLPDYLSQFRKQYGVGTPVNLGIGGGGSLGGNDKFSRFLQAIAGQESGGSGYRRVNPDSGALGKYQIMPSNIAGWSKAILGHSITPSQFLHSNAYQDQIASGMLKNYVKKYGYQGAAAAWYGGPGVAKRWSGLTNPQGAYPSIASYVNQIMRRMG